MKKNKIYLVAAINEQTYLLMKYTEYSHRHGKELLQLIHPNIVREVHAILDSLEPFKHGAQKGKTVKSYISDQ